MSDKQRAKTMLCELQMTCSKRNGVCDGDDVETCEYSCLCASMFTDEAHWIRPLAWNLNDPPRFNEAQMAFWRGWYAVGARFVKRRVGTGCVDFSLTTKDFCVSNSCVLPNNIAIQLEEGKVYDLAKLLGKDAT